MWKYIENKKSLPTLLIKVDSTSVTLLCKDGGTDSITLAKEAEKIWQYLWEKVVMRLEHIPSKKNLADSLSRIPDLSSGKLEVSAFHMINHYFGPLHLNLFADRTNHQLPTNFSWYPGPGAQTVDARVQRYPQTEGMAFHLCLIGRVLSR